MLEINDNLPTMPISVMPFKHQRKAYLFTLGLFDIIPSDVHSCEAALLMEMGTGKSLTAISVAGTMFKLNKVRRLLVVSPLSINGVWSEEFEKFAAFHYTLTVLEGSCRKRAETLKKFSGEGLNVAVVNYESTWRLEKELMRWKPDMIICDEGHKIKSHNTSVSKTMHKLGAMAKYKEPRGLGICGNVSR